MASEQEQWCECTNCGQKRYVAPDTFVCRSCFCEQGEPSAPPAIDLFEALKESLKAKPNG